MYERELSQEAKLIVEGRQEIVLSIYSLFARMKSWLSAHA